MKELHTYVQYFLKDERTGKITDTGLTNMVMNEDDYELVKESFETGSFTHMTDDAELMEGLTGPGEASIRPELVMDYPREVVSGWTFDEAYKNYRKKQDMIREQKEMRMNRE